MKTKNRVLAKDRLGYTTVFLCKHGIVHLNYMNTSLRFKPEDFSKFALLISDAYYRLNNNSSLPYEDKGEIDEMNGLDI